MFLNDLIGRSSRRSPVKAQTNKFTFTLCPKFSKESVFRQVLNC